MSKYGVLDRLGVGIIDLFGVLWLRRRFTVPELVDTETAQVETPFAETPQAEAAMRNAAPPLRAARPEPALR
jgi:hypothetical protein